MSGRNICLKKLNAERDPHFHHSQLTISWKIHHLRLWKRTGGEEIPLFSASAEDSKLCSVLAKEKTIIPARSECLIQGVPEASGKFRYVITDFPSQVSQKGVLLAATLVDLKKEAIPVRVLNLDHKPKTINKGAVIATCEQWWISLLVLKNFPNHYASRQSWRILKGLMKNNEQQ
ncbi:hypothetical protein AVEN_196179-1 [Araneus ventricosus]|uniref:Uncharacterized protein n=1 Tax=Araneus ventricosus TaxID=182803 RepID=A0A4Y2FCK9_ARAVE|nr:hypothetical protein AVEN_196179-1 [Araneus ventricosus]